MEYFSPIGPNLRRPSAAVFPCEQSLIVKGGERSGASQEPLIMRANRVGCQRTVGEGGRNNFMDNEIRTSRGSFGRIQVTLPMDIKTKMTQWYQKSGLRKAEFFRVALMIGVCILADSVNAKSELESYLSDEDNQTDAIART